MKILYFYINKDNFYRRSQKNEEKTEKVKGLFDSKPKRGLFGNKKVIAIKINKPNL